MTLAVMVSLTVDGKSQPECRPAQQGIIEKEINKEQRSKKDGSAKKQGTQQGNGRGTYLWNCRKISTTTGK
jgi:hypothetical protein